jgi:hypothetical protein
MWRNCRNGATLSGLVGKLGKNKKDQESLGDSLMLGFYEEFPPKRT